MKSKQKELFLESEGDNYFTRNKEVLENLSGENDFLLQEIIKFKDAFPATSPSILEIGCSNGKRLIELQKLGFTVAGIDPSGKAIDAALKMGLNAHVATADKLPFENKTFDVVTFGFCLYVCDREDLFKIAAEADRVLKDAGFIFIFDFYSKNNQENKYHHRDGIATFKMDYRKLFDWHPNYTLVQQSVGSHKDFAFTDDKNELVSISVIRKKN